MFSDQEDVDADNNDSIKIDETPTTVEEEVDREKRRAALRDFYEVVGLFIIFLIMIC